MELWGYEMTKNAVKGGELGLQAAPVTAPVVTDTNDASAGSDSIGFMPTADLSRRSEKELRKHEVSTWDEPAPRAPETHSAPRADVNAQKRGAGKAHQRHELVKEKRAQLLSRLEKATLLLARVRQDGKGNSQESGKASGKESNKTSGKGQTQSAQTKAEKKILATLRASLEGREAKQDIRQLASKTLSDLKKTTQELVKKNQFSGETRAGLEHAKTELTASLGEFTNSLEHASLGSEETLTPAAQPSEVATSGSTVETRTAGSTPEAVLPAHAEVVQKLTQELQAFGPATTVTPENLETAHQEIKTQCKQQLAGLTQVFEGLKEAQAKLKSMLPAASASTTDEQRPEAKVQKLLETQLKEVSEKVATIRASLTKLDKIENQILRMKSYKELKDSVEKDTTPTLQAASSSDSAAHEVLTLLKAASAGEEPQQGTSATASATPSFGGSQYLSAASGGNVQAASGGAGDGSALLSIASGNNFISDQKKEKVKMDKLIQDILLAIQSGNVDAISDALIVMGLQSKRTLLGVASHVVKALQVYDQQLQKVSEDMGKITGTEKNANATMQKLSLDMSTYSMGRTALVNSLRDVQTMNEEIDNVANSWLNIVGQQKRQLSRFQS